MQNPDEPHDPTGSIRRVQDGYPVVEAPAAGSRLGRMLTRLAAALDAAALERPASVSVRANLIDLVPRLRRYAAALTDDPAEANDLVQSTLLRAWETRENLPTGPALAAWLFAVLRRGHSHERRRSRPERAAEAGCDGATAREDVPGRRAVRAALDRLTQAQREALLLVTVEGLSREAAAAIIDCPVAAVRERLVQAHDRLARDLGPA